MPGKMHTRQGAFQDTIAAIATAEGVSSISIVRISGEGALEIAKKVSALEKIIPRHAHLTSLYTKEHQLIDQAIMIYFAAPNSFTGEDIVEFQCHGGLIVSQEILDTVLCYGARLAEAGEFSKRAFLNGKIDLSEAEAIAKLIEAKSVDAAKILARQLKGEIKDFIEQSREILLKSLAYAEVSIDYAEEDIPQDMTESMHRELDVLEEKIESIVEASYRRRGLIEGFKVAIIGKPNVGKSSLLNALLNDDRAIVSDIAGTTRDTIEEQIRIGTHVIRLVDTAGIRDAKDRIEKIGISRSISAIEDADIIIALFDYSRQVDKEDQKILSLLEQMQNKHIIVALNKSDLPLAFDRSILDSYSPLEVSAKKSFSILTEHLEALLDTIGEAEEITLISTRQIEAAKAARDAIKEAKRPLLHAELEFYSYHLQEALKALSLISKPYDNEEILEKMFAEFCLGK